MTDISKKTMTREPRTDQELRKIALDTVEGRIFASWMIPESDSNMVRLIFMPLGLMGPEDVEGLIADEVAHFFTPMDQALPRAINGYPIFMRMATITKSESERLWVFLERAQKMRQEFLGEALSPEATGEAQ